MIDGAMQIESLLKLAKDTVANCREAVEICAK